MRITGTLLKIQLIALSLTFFMGVTGHAQSESVLLKKSFNEVATPKSKRFFGDWTASLVGQNGQDEFNQRNLLEMVLRMRLNYRLLETLHLNLTPSFTYLTGYSQTELGERADTTEWSVKNADVTVFPNGIVELKAGALNQTPFHSHLLLGDRAFPSLALTLQTSSIEGYRFGVRGQSAIATSSSLSTETEDLEPTPTFSSAGIFAEVNNTTLKSRLRINAFQFRNLPRSMATLSVLRGNTAIDESEENLTESEFKYQFQGFEASWDLSFNLTRSIRPQVQVAGVQNQKAPKGQNTGTSIRSGVEIFPSESFSFTPFYQFSRIESDAAVSGYASTLFETNRIGYSAGCEIQIQKTLNLTLAGGERDVLIESPSQFRERFWKIGLETFNVAL